MEVKWFMKKKNSLRKVHRAAFGGAMALNTAQLMSPGANPMNVLQGGIGIGVAGIVSDKIFDLTEQTKKRKRR